ncbi:MAG: protein translocase subunit SecF [Desulfovibrionaceae bacterium]|nr:MAG: protein translocase subunit SecF [Desulfovibrionaceae bacterium]
MALAILKHTTHIDFVGVRRYAYAFSAVVILLGLVAIFMNGGLRYGVDFAGGVMVQIQFTRPVEDEAVKKAVADIDMPGLTVQQVGDDSRNYLLRFSVNKEGATENLRNDVNEALRLSMPDNPAGIERLEMVGPKVGGELRNMAVEALFYSVLLITVYISGRFEHSWMLAGAMAVLMWGVVYGAGWLAELIGWTGYNRLWGVAVAMAITVYLTWKFKLNFALGAIISLLHDVFTTLGLLMVLGREIDLNIIAALLTLVGYSLNDTIIVYDRIRENLKAIPEGGPRPTMDQIINRSLNQTLARTILTSGTTLVTCISLYVLGGSVIHDFSLTLLLGILFGTFSSVYVASPVLRAFGSVDMYCSAQKRNDDYERPGEHGIV